MEFVAVLGARQGQTFTPLRWAVWSLLSEKAGISSGTPTTVAEAAQVDRQGTGIPPGVAMDAAMSGRTCRFMARRLETEPDPAKHVCRPSIT